MKKINTLLIACTVGIQLAFAVDPNHPYDDRRAPSSKAPVKNPPMLIALSSDDNFDIGGMQWILETLKSRKHHDGSSLRMSFYSNSGFSWHSDSYIDSLYGTFLEAYKGGNEVTSHTQSHPFCVNGDTRLSDTVILHELESNIEDLASIGIKKEHMYGFRTPYVTYTDSTFIAVKKAGFTYDASINDGIDLKPGEYHWPYTLDTKNSNNLNEDGLENPPLGWDTTQGPRPEPVEPSYAPGNHLAISYNNYMNDTPIRRHSGLWELPLYALRVPDSLIAPLDSSLGYKSGGMSIPALEVLIQQGGFTKERALATLKHHFRLIYEGNRSPMVVVFHTPNFSTTFSDFDDKYPNCSDPLDRQWIIEQFIDFALEQDDVWFVSGEQVINFCKEPVSVDAFRPDDFTAIPIDTSFVSIADEGGNPVSTNMQLTYHDRAVSISLPTPQKVTVAIISTSGRKLFEQQRSIQAGMNSVAIPVELSAGSYIVQISGAAINKSMKITIQ